MGLFGGDEEDKKGLFGSVQEKAEKFQEQVEENKKNVQNSAHEKFHSQKRADEVNEYIDNSEKVEGVLKISGITHDDDDDSFLGENSGGGIRNSNQVAIFTNERVLTRLPAFLSTDTSTIRYENIKSVETKYGMVKRKLILRTSGEDYHLVAFDSKPVINVASEFVREKISEGAESSTVQVEESPIEKIEQLKELYDNGAISEQEFKSKKEELLDEI